MKDERESLKKTLAALPIQDFIELNRHLAAETRAQEKHTLEIEILENQRNEVQRSRWKQYQPYAAFAPTMLAAIGLFLTWYTGYFDARKSELSAEKKLLDLQVQELDSRRADYTAQVNTLKNELDYFTETAQRLLGSTSTSTNLLLRLSDFRGLIDTWQFAAGLAHIRLQEISNFVATNQNISEIREVLKKAEHELEMRYRDAAITSKENDENDRLRNR